MQSLKATFSHPKFKHYLLYCISLVVLGIAVVSLGTLLPYLSAQEGRLETEYSFLFLCRAAGFITSSFSVKLIEKYCSFHNSLCIGCLMNGIFFIVFLQTINLNLKGFFIYFASIGSGLIDVFANVATIETFKGKQLASWLQILHGVFGIGGLMGPFIVYLFELHTPTIIGVLMLCLAPFFYVMSSPQIKNQHQTQELLDQKEIKPVQNISRFSNYMIACIFYFVAGQQCTFGGWVASYSVLSGFSTKEHATMYSSLYWVSVTFFRFTLTLITGRPSSKIYWLFALAVIQTFVSTFLILHIDSQLGLIMSAIMFGLSNSALFPLLLILPDQFHLGVTPGQNSNFMLLASIGDGTMTVLVGSLMKTFSYNWFLYSMGLINLLALIMHHVTLKHLQEEAKSTSVPEQEKQDIEMDKIHRKENIS